MIIKNRKKIDREFIADIHLSEGLDLLAKAIVQLIVHQ